jgi:hypothetical protein
MTVVHADGSWEPPADEPARFTRQITLALGSPSDVRSYYVGSSGALV